MYFSVNAMAIDSICNIMVQYKEENSVLKSRGGSASFLAQNGSKPGDVIAQVNSYIWDMSMLWRCKMLDSSTPSASSSLSCDMGLEPPIKRRVIDAAKTRKFLYVSHSMAITHSVAFVGYATDFHVKYMKHIGEKGIEYDPQIEKVHLVDFLKNSCEFTGLHAFLYMTVKSLQQPTQP